MRLAAPFAVLLFLASACGALRGVVGEPGGHSARMGLWEQAHDAYSRDSFRVATAAFQRLVNEHPRSFEGHEARFYLGALSLEPRSRVSLDDAEQHLSLYLTADSLRQWRSYHTREGLTLLHLVRQLKAPCDQRVPGLECTVTVVTAADTVTRRVVTGQGAESGDVARLRRELAERERTIRDLREELQRIRNTLAPPRPPR